jgi:hypothetical protein
MPLNWNFPAKIGPKTGKQVTALAAIVPEGTVEQRAGARRPIYRSAPAKTLVERYRFQAQQALK